MRTTIDLPENLHRIAMGLARHTGRSLSLVVTELLQRALEMRPADSQSRGVVSRHPATGLPVARSVRPISADDVHAIDEVG